MCVVLTVRTDAQRKYDREWQARRRAEQPERVAANRRRSRARNPYKPIDPGLKRARHVEAAKRRWAEGSTLRTRAQARQRARELRNDLKLLDRVIRGIRSRLKERDWARQYWRANSDQLNDRRNFRAVIRRLDAQPSRQAAEFKARQAALQQVALKVARRHVWRDARRIQARLKRILRRQFQKAFRYCGSYSQAIPRLTGCTLEALRLHLERLWQPGMSWANYGFYGWHIDHIRPIAAFDLTQEDQRRQCFHFSNLQPLWKDQNFSKRDLLSEKCIRISDTVYRD